jgi:hypothetical protein
MLREAPEEWKEKALVQALKVLAPCLLAVAMFLVLAIPAGADGGMAGGGPAGMAGAPAAGGPMGQAPASVAGAPARAGGLDGLASGLALSGLGLLVVGSALVVSRRPI